MAEALDLGPIWFWRGRWRHRDKPGALSRREQSVRLELDATFQRKLEVAAHLRGVTPTQLIEQALHAPVPWSETVRRHR